MSKTIVQRMLDPLKSIGVDMSDRKQVAELYAYQMAITAITNEFTSMKAAKDASIGRFPAETFDLSRANYTIDGSLITFTKYTQRNISKTVNSTIPKFYDISLNKNGWTWETIESKGENFYKINSDGYRWDLIESR
ncbi:MAG TPA: hypothetical protein DCZ02_06020 [Ruminococcaceae bacterium]|nr:hypothetical protein [Oscillospiraceae bacterium]